MQDQLPSLVRFAQQGSRVILRNASVTGGRKRRDWGSMAFCPGNGDISRVGEMDVNPEVRGLRDASRGDWACVRCAVAPDSASSDEAVKTFEALICCAHIVV